MTTLLAFLFVLGVLVFVHELGHFLAAKREEWHDYIRHVSPWEVDRDLAVYKSGRDPRPLLRFPPEPTVPYGTQLDDALLGLLVLRRREDGGHFKSVARFEADCGNR